MQASGDEPATTSRGWVTRRRPTAVRISGPATCRVIDPPPRFVVEAGRAVLFMVELAAGRHLMTSIADRTPDNYHYGGDVDGGFAVGREWSMPQDVWGRLCRLPLFFYRVVAFDQVAGESTLSVDDRNLHLLPVLRLQPPGRRPTIVIAGAGKHEPPVSSRSIRRHGVIHMPPPVCVAQIDEQR